MSKALKLLQEMEAGEVFCLRVPGGSGYAHFQMRGADGDAAYVTDGLTPAQVDEIREWLLTDAVPFTGKVLN